VAALLEPGRALRGVTIQLKSGTPADEIEFPEGPVRQILFNLLQNAIDATPAGETVVIETAVTDGSLCLAVRDRGAGIPEADRERICLPFFTTKKGRTPGGLGLGLSVTRNLVELLKGSIDFTQEPGGGTCFQVEFPLTGAGKAPHPRGTGASRVPAE